MKTTDFENLEVILESLDYKSDLYNSLELAITELRKSFHKSSIELDFRNQFDVIDEPTFLNVSGGDVFALDLRDGSDFLLDESHPKSKIEKLIGSGDFLFGTEK